MATVDDILSLEVRVGTVVAARVQRGARTPAYALSIDFGAAGTKSASARIADLYEPDELVGLQVVAVINVPPKEVAGFRSDVLVLAIDNGTGEQVLVIPERPVPDGCRVG